MKGKLISFLILFLISFVIVFFVKYDIKKIQTSDGEMNIEKKISFSLDGYKYFRKGLDVAGGVRLTYKIDFSKYEQVYSDSQEFFKIKKQIREIIKTNIENRISKLGVSDYSINILNLNGQDYLQVEIGGIHDLDYAKKVIGKTVELEFKVVYLGENYEKIKLQRQKLAENILKQVVFSGKDFLLFQNIDEGIYYFNNIFPKSELPDGIKENINDIIEYGTGKVYPRLISGSMDIIYPPLFGGLTTKKYNGWFVVKNNGILSGNKYNLELLFITDRPFWVIAQSPKTKEILNGAYFKYATVGRDDRTGQPVAIIQFNDKGKQIFCDITKKYLNKQMAIFVGNKLVTAPVIQAEICGGTTQISGNFTPEEAKKLVKDLNEGALPAKLILAHEEKISPVLGEKALMGAIIAGIVGLILIYILLLWMYNFKWANIALLSLFGFLLVIFAVVKLTDYALSLSGIAAILLSIGIAVDANILMYERIKEELKAGNSYFIALKNGFERSWNAIRDGNLTTGMIALILFLIGMNVFKGFGTMMLLNIIVTLFILVPFTKTLLENFEDK